MDALDTALETLSRARSWGYHAASATATEPTALTALALLAQRKSAAAQAALEQLLAIQDSDGCLGVMIDQALPGWPTAWAVLAWQAAGDPRFAEPIRRGVDWLLATHGDPVESHGQMGHDGSLIGWPWAVGTHSWLEPTALAVLALKATGHADHPRTREAVRLIIDRLLPDGGANYGNTLVLGQMLRPHVEPSGLCLLALAGESSTDPRIARTIEYLQQEVGGRITPVSLGYALLGLNAHDAAPKNSTAWISAAIEKSLARDPSCYKLALLALAAAAKSLPWLSRPYIHT